MPLYLIPPGQRIKRVRGKEYPNRYWIIRGDLGGEPFEATTKTTEKEAAERLKAEVEHEWWNRRVPERGEAVTLSRAADAYLAWKSPPKWVERRIRRLVAAIGADRDVGSVGVADFVAAGDLLYPGGKPETKNRWAIKPGAAILHYAAESGWCEWVRVRKLKEGPKVNRPADAPSVQLLLAALEEEAEAAPTSLKRRAAGRKLLLLVWLMKHGPRISDPLRITWPQIDLPARTYRALIGKKNEWREKPLDDEVWDLLANIPKEERQGRLFPWRTRSGVYKWLRPLVREKRVTFTPHMARHYVGTELNAAGEGLKTIMEALDHSDATSSLRYQSAGVKVVRQALRGLDKMVGNKPRRRRKC